METGRINPRYISRPIQLLAAWMVGLVAINGSFLMAAGLIKAPTWAPALLVIAAVGNVPIFLFCLFLLQTKFRPEMQEDQYYSEYLSNRGFKVMQMKMENFTKQADVAANLIRDVVGGEVSEQKRKQIKDILTKSEIDRLTDRIGERRSLSELYLFPNRWEHIVSDWGDDDNFKVDIGILQSEGAVTMTNDYREIRLTELGRRIAEEAEKRNILWHQRHGGTHPKTRTDDK